MTGCGAPFFCDRILEEKKGLTVCLARKLECHAKSTQQLGEDIGKLQVCQQINSNQGVEGLDMMLQESRRVIDPRPIGREEDKRFHFS